MSMDFDLGSSADRPASPIADLSYRGYDGPLATRLFRWWIVALAGIRLTLKKPIFWIMVLLCVLPYLVAGIRLFLQSRLSATLAANNPFLDMTPGQKYASEFFGAFSFQQFFLFLVALIIGSGSIAADNRANALLVYLSKPITKGDYLLGKWMGVFLPLFAIALAPALLLYLDCLLSYTDDGFLRDEPLLIVHLVLACMVPAVIYTSLMLGISAWSKTPRMAVAFMAGFYFISYIVVMTVWNIRYDGAEDKGVLLRSLSLGGLVEGLARSLLHVTLHITHFHRRTFQLNRMDVPPPSLAVLLAIAAALCLAGILATRARIRAVEVVRG